MKSPPSDAKPAPRKKHTGPWSSHPVPAIALFLSMALGAVFMFLAFLFFGFWVWLQPPVWVSIIMGASQLVMFVLMMAGQLLGHTVLNPFVQWFVRATSVLIALLFYGWLAGVLLLIAFFIILAVAGMEFIQTYGSLVAEIMALLLVGSILIGMCLARRIGVTHLTIPTKRLKKKKVRLVLISDLHIGPILGPGFLAKVRRIVKAQHPDVLIAAGDLVDTKAELLARWSKDFKVLFSLAPTYCVTGNHELINGLDETVELLGGCGARFLRDAAAVDEGTGITIIGMEEPPNQMQRKFEFTKLEKLLNDADPERPVVVVNHQPRGFEVVADHGAELMLSGHTHGGQMWPFSYFVKMTYGKYTKGLNTLKGSRIYTLNGTGTWGPPMRLGANPEVLVVDLVKCK